MEITREIEDKSRYFEGKPGEDWEFLGMKERERCYLSYYRDGQGNYHHKSVKRKAKYNPYKTEVYMRDGMEFARVVNKKTGQPIAI